MAAMTGRPRSYKYEGKCLSMHQPWASLLVYGIKRIEGRGWPTDHRGRLWIAATAKQPTQEEIQEMESFYRSVFEADGCGTIQFPPSYPTGVLLGCVDVADCLKAEQVEAWEVLPTGLKTEVGSPYCFLCQNAQRLVVPQQMRGWPKLFDLEKKLHKVAQLGLKPAPNSRELNWAAFSTPPAADTRLPASQNKHKYQEFQRRMDAAREGPCLQLEAAAATATAGSTGDVDGPGSSSAIGSSGGEARKTGGCQSPRAAAAGLPHAVALQQRRQPEPSPPAAEQQQQEPQKRLRAVQKKLRQIVLLEERQRAGQALLPEELAKLQQRGALEAEAAELQVQGT